MENGIQFQDTTLWIGFVQSGYMNPISVEWLFPTFAWRGFEQIEWWIVDAVLSQNLGVLLLCVAALVFWGELSLFGAIAERLHERRQAAGARTTDPGAKPTKEG